MLKICKNLYIISIISVQLKINFLAKNINNHNNHIMNILSILYLGLLTIGFMYISEYTLIDMFQLIILSLFSFAIFTYTSENYKFSNHKFIFWLQKFVYYSLIFALIVLAARMLYLVGVNLTVFDSIFCESGDFVVETINSDIKKSSIIDFDYWWDTFESANSLTKVILLLMFSSYMILSGVFGITVNLYGSYILDRFNLENRFPKIAIIIKYRQKASKYYVVFNILYITSICLINIIFGLTALSFLYLPQ